ncbi:cilia- and flagella-associated protein 298 [Halyomorpha halys]|uniref:cilia- and flagella-associated protein 298 n=1 Tax=Halyomorpha halys TaxID=286706 RepID=UPI0006D50040|nr:UPF0769 protein C21orf59 homolog [Halyomorpha halys]
MVILHVKKADESQFLFNVSVEEDMDKVIAEVTDLYNGRLKVSRLCYEIEELSKHGTQFPPDIIGLYEDQVKDLGLKDDWGDICEPSGGYTFEKDPVGRRNGKKPQEHMAKILTKTVEEARGMLSKKLVTANKPLDKKKLKEALDILRGAVTIVYPMGLPPHDPIRLEFEGKEDLSGTHASLEVIEESRACLWFSGKEMSRGKKLKDYVGSNEKTKITVKLSKSGHGAPAREPICTEEEKNRMMWQAKQREEEMKRLEENQHEYEDTPWAEGGRLKRAFQGMGNISWKPR